MHLGVTCQYFKLVLHKPHDNSYNLFSQVGLMKLQFIGRPLGDYEVKALKGNSNLQAQYGQRPGLPSSPRQY